MKSTEKLIELKPGIRLLRSDSEVEACEPWCVDACVEVCQGCTTGELDDCDFWGGLHVYVEYVEEMQLFSTIDHQV